MAYEPTVWKTGDIVTSTRLNKIENELANSSDGADMFIVTFTYGQLEYTADKTYSEILEALENGKSVMGICGRSTGPAVSVTYYEGEDHDRIIFVIPGYIDGGYYYLNQMTILDNEEVSCATYKAAVTAE